MSTPETIIASLNLMANHGRGVAAIWHISVLMALIGIVSGWRPSRRIVALALSMPLFSVGAVGWHHLNVVFGSVFTVLPIVLALVARQVRPEGPGRPPRWALGLGIATAIYGLVYPNYLDGAFLWYLYAAPMGVLPCPTLAFAIGVALVIDDIGSRAWPLLLAVTGLAFAILALVTLRAWLDLGLILGAAGLLVRTLARRRQPAEGLSA
jgi:hypothetical protein